MLVLVSKGLPPPLLSPFAVFVLAGCVELVFDSCVELSCVLVVLSLVVVDVGVVLVSLLVDVSLLLLLELSVLVLISVLELLVSVVDVSVLELSLLELVGTITPGLAVGIVTLSSALVEVGIGFGAVVVVVVVAPAPQSADTTLPARTKARSDLSGVSTPLQWFETSAATLFNEFLQP